MKKRTHCFLLCDEAGPFFAVACRRDGRCSSGWKPFASRTIRKPGPPFEWLGSGLCECGCGNLGWDSEAEEEIALWLDLELARCRGEKS